MARYIQLVRIYRVTQYPRTGYIYDLLQQNVRLTSMSYCKEGI